VEVAVLTAGAASLSGDLSLPSEQATKFNITINVTDDKHDILCIAAVLYGCVIN
jgi:hypothetical protein